MATGVCIPSGFPRSDLCRLLTRKGCAPPVWYESPEAVIAALREVGLDLFIFGVQRPDGETREQLGLMLGVSPSTKVILICARSGESDTRKALDVGAHALVPLDDVEDALLPVIEVVRAGQVSVPSAARREAGRRVLTAREKQILGQVVLGMSNAEIAKKLFLAESTVKSHLSSAFAKLGVTSRNEAAALILNPSTGTGLGILTIPSEKLSVSG